MCTACGGAGYVRTFQGSGNSSGENIGYEYAVPCHCMASLQPPTYGIGPARVVWNEIAKQFVLERLPA